MKAVVIILTVGMVVCGCQKADTSSSPQSLDQSETAKGVGVAGNSERITIQRISQVRDKLAYGSYRGVYIIKDAATGKEYIGVSGIGIAETGSHTSGKTTASDER